MQKKAGMSRVKLFFQTSTVLLKIKLRSWSPENIWLDECGGRGKGGLWGGGGGGVNSNNKHVNSAHYSGSDHLKIYGT